MVTSLSNRPAPAACTYLHKKKPPLHILRRTPSPHLMQSFFFSYIGTRAHCGLWPVEQCGVVSSLQPGHYSTLPGPNLQPTANQEGNDQCGNQHYSRELLMMGIVVPETC
jgi:hypothetical protein